MFPLEYSETSDQIIKQKLNYKANLSSTGKTAIPHRKFLVRADPT